MDYKDFKNLAPVEYLTEDDYKAMAVEVQPSDKDRLLQVIYAPNEVTGLPSSDYALYLSENVNPVVRDYIAKNLLQPTSSKNLIPSNFTEDVSEFMRGEYETPREYAERITPILDKMKSDARNRTSE